MLGVKVSTQTMAGDILGEGESTEVDGHFGRYFFGTPSVRTQPKEQFPFNRQVDCCFDEDCEEEESTRKRFG